MAGVSELTDNDFQQVVENAATPVLVDFSATWCQPCKALAPLIDAVAQEYDARILVHKVDIDNAPDTAVRFGIQGVPTCIFFKDGAEVDRFIGMTDLDDIRSRCEKVLA